MRFAAFGFATSLLFAIPAHAQLSNEGMTGCTWTGTWETEWGELRLIHRGDKVSGDYGPKGTLEGVTTKPCELTGTFTNSGGYSGRFEFTKQSVMLLGKYGLGEDPVTQRWTGTIKSDVIPTLQTAVPPPLEPIGILDPSQIPNQTGTFQVGETMLPGNPITEAVEAQSRAEKLRETRRNAAERTRREREAWQEEQNVQRERERRTMNRDQMEGRTGRKPQWRVSLEALCSNKADDESGTELVSAGDALGLELYGMAWIKARAINRKTGQQEDIPPLTSWPNVNGDKERAWEKLRDRAFAAGYGGRYAKYTCMPLEWDINSDKPKFVEYVYAFDLDALGYDSLESFLAESRNRIDVMFHVKERDFVSADDDFGTRRRATSLKDADFCGACSSNLDFFIFGVPQPGPGVLRGFSSDGAEAEAYYSIKQVQ